MRDDRGDDPGEKSPEPTTSGQFDPTTVAHGHCEDETAIHPDGVAIIPSLPNPDPDPGSTYVHPPAGSDPARCDESTAEAGLGPGSRRQTGQMVAGRFVLGSRLGDGGQGEVWRATQTEPFAREVALKLLRPDLEFDPDRLRRFRLEASRWAKVPGGLGILPIYEFGEDHGRPFITMQLVEGYHLGQVIGQRRDRLAGRSPAGLHRLAVLPEADYLVAIARLLAHVARALHVAHEAHIVHRDVKPSNVLLDRVDEAGIYLADFGLARNLDDVSLNPRYAVVGTLGFIAPERLRGLANIDEIRSDVFGLGVTLFEAVTLVRAFEIPKDYAPELRVPYLLGLETPEPRKARPGLPRDLEAVILKAIDPAPGRRYPTAAALAADLDRFAHDEPVEARPPGALRRSIRRAGRHPRALAAVGVLALVAAMVGLGIVADRVATERRLVELEAEADDLIARGDVEGAAEAALRALERAPDHRRTADLVDRVADALFAEIRDATDGAGGGRSARWLALLRRLGKLDTHQQLRFAEAAGLQDLRIASDTPGAIVTFHATTDDGRPRPGRLLYGPIVAGSPAAPTTLPDVVGGTYWVTATVTGSDAFVERHLVVPRGMSQAGAMPVLLLRPRTHDQATAGLVAMPGGRCEIGEASPKNDQSHSPPHRVELAPYYLAPTESTEAQFGRYLIESGQRDRAEQRWGPTARPTDDRADLPVTKVTFRQATEYAAWYGLRLASEAELEAAGRGQGRRSMPPGVDAAALASDPAWSSLHPARSHPADHDEATGLWGLFGNAGELTLYALRPYPANPQQRFNLDATPFPARWVGRVVRSGLIENYSDAYRPILLGYHLRGSQPPEEANSGLVGFRCSRSADPIVGRGPFGAPTAMPRP